MKNERKTIMQAVARAERLEMGKAIKLGLIGEKELKNLTKAYKEYTADPVVKAAAKAKTFARWLGSVALDNGTVLPILRVDQFGSRIAYVLPIGEGDDITSLPESNISLEQVKRIVHVADLCSADDRANVLFSVEDARWETDESQKISWPEVYGILKNPYYLKDWMETLLRKREAIAALFVAVCDEQYHTICGSNAPETVYSIFAPTKQAAEWLRHFMNVAALRPDSIRLQADEQGTFLLGSASTTADNVHIELTDDMPQLTEEDEKILSLVMDAGIIDDLRLKLEGIWKCEIHSPRRDLWTEAELWRQMIAVIFPSSLFGEASESIDLAMDVVWGMLWKKID